MEVCGKLNLSLNITGRSGGYHTLDSVVASVSCGDTVIVRERKDNGITLNFEANFTPEVNSVTRAVEELHKTFGDFGADITVIKRLPLAGGMGGSSADAAGVIAALGYIYGFDGALIRKACLAVGSDVPYMLEGGYARMRGRGEAIEPIACDKEYGVVLVRAEGTETARVYAEYDRVGGDTPVDNDEMVKRLTCVRKFDKIPLGNMLARAAIGLNPRIALNLAACERAGLNANMTGSGSTVYAFTSDPEGDAERLKKMGLDAYAAHTCASGLKIYRV